MYRFCSAVLSFSTGRSWQTCVSFRDVDDNMRIALVKTQHKLLQTCKQNCNMRPLKRVCIFIRDLSQQNDLESSILDCFLSHSNEVKSAASFALGTFYREVK